MGLAKIMTDIPPRTFGLRDIVLIAVLAAVSGVVYTGIGQIWLAASTAFGPLGGSLIGLFQFGHILAYALLRKPGVILATSILSTVVQALIGDPTGILVIGWGVAHGLGSEAVALAARYRSTSFWTLVISAGVGALLGQFFSYWLYGWEHALWMFFVSLPIVFVASGLESGGLAFFVAAKVRQSGVLQR
jgi:energy-coupling factor transport system substrate-specific component